MNTSSFLQALRTHAALPLVFGRGRDELAPSYHLTEVKELTFRTMDCGAMTHRWSENHFELWVPDGASEAGRAPMAAEKFLRIVDRVEQEIPLDAEVEAKVLASIADAPAAVHTIESVAPDARGRLVVALRADAARCKARERRTEAGCGCNHSAAQAPAFACCT